MKQKLKLCMVLLIVFSISKFLNATHLKNPVKIEVITKHTSFDEALKAAKDALLIQNFIATNGIQEK